MTPTMVVHRLSLSSPRVVQRMAVWMVQQLQHVNQQRIVHRETEKGSFEPVHVTVADHERL